MHTFVTNLRGPDQRLRFLGAEISGVSAVAIVPGNVTASFVVVSYAGQLDVTIGQTRVPAPTCLHAGPPSRSSSRG